MKKRIQYITYLFFASAFSFVILSSFNSDNRNSYTPNESLSIKDTLPPGERDKDTSRLKYPLRTDRGYPFSTSSNSSPMLLNDPSNMKKEIIYNPRTKQYEFSENIGKIRYSNSTAMNMEEYRRYEMKNALRDYWRERAQSENTGRNSLLGTRQLTVGGEAFSTIFGSNTIDITPKGSAELIFELNITKTENPTLSERLRKVTSFVFEEKIQMNVTGNIGDKMSLGINYNTEATFDFENKTKLGYTGEEDEIIQKIEAGNITLPLPGSLITGSQSLFGVKTELKFGKLSVTSVFSQQKGESSVVEMKNGAQVQEFEVEIDEYDANRHFFLSHYFKENYDKWLSDAYPAISSPIEITQIEVWITNKNRDYEDARNIVAFADIGEGYTSMDDDRDADNVTSNNVFIYPINNYSPRNEINDLYQQLTTSYAAIRDVDNVTNVLLNAGFEQGVEFEKIENARKLTEREYSLNSKLGYISLNSSLNADEVLMVSYKYRNNIEQTTYTVGELSTEAEPDPNTIIAKLLKGTAFTPKMPTWELMMKNIYSVGAYQVETENFVLEILYRDDNSGAAINYLNESRLPKDHSLNDSTLLMALGLDRLNAQQKANPDGIFDFFRGVTIQPDRGRIIFPVLEPFGSHMRKVITDYNPDDPNLDRIAEKYVFDELYDSTRTIAKQIAEKNKFFIGGTYQSSSGSEISLNAMNVPKGSVKVTAGGRELQENVDYTVDYTLGRVKIINPSIMESGTPVRISLESQSLFNIQTKTMVGTHLNYQFSENFNLGATVLNLTERPLTQKVGFGDEPISNTIWGFNTSYSTNSQILTTAIDKLPFLETKEVSNITFEGEFAHLIPGQSKAIGRNGTSYIDDFEGSETSIEMKSYPQWELASIPRDILENNPFAVNGDPLSINYGRGKLAWYVIDPLFLRDNSSTPEHIKRDDNAKSSHYVREIFEKEIWPNKDNPQSLPTNLSVLNVAFYPRERGPYNYTFNNLNYDGSLANPTQRWGGIMREVPTPDFEAANVEFIEFWLMDPYAEHAGDGNENGGRLVINLGNVSEDIMKDSKKMFEHGLPSTEEYDSNTVVFTPWGRVPNLQSLVTAFDNDITSRKFQDVGLDGLNSEAENDFFSTFIDSIEALFSSGGISAAARDKLISDPSSDDFMYFRSSDYDDIEAGILQRYKKFNGLEGNSPVSEDTDEEYPTIGSVLPNVEDIDEDNTLSESENYYQYNVDLSQNGIEGVNGPHKYITDTRVASVELANGQSSNITWYQFKIPVSDIDGVVGNISGFESIRFMRMYLDGFQDSIILRFARLDLVRSEWRKYQYSFREAGELPANPQAAEGNFDILAVNIEENGEKTPVNYILPPGVNRQIDPTNPQIQRLNEQAIVLRVNELDDGDARAAYKNVDLDLRQYGTIKMWVHAEAFEDDPSLADGDLTAFIRLGSDYKDNYYEFEVPLVLTPSVIENGEKYSDSEDENDPDRKIVWRPENQFVINLDYLKEAKKARNDAVETNPNVSKTQPFTYTDPNTENIITVVGNPNLSNVRTLILGIRNPSVGNRVNNTNDKLPKSGEIWFNELRVTDFNNRGGWAANARLSAKLADFGSVNIAGNISTPGFGSIDQKVNERSKEDVKQYDLSTNLQMGKFFKEDLGVNLPIYYGISETFITPEFDPTDPDILFKESLERKKTVKEKEDLKKASQDYTKRTSFNLANVSMNPEGTKKPGPLHVSNFSTTWSWNQTQMHNINVENSIEKNQKALFLYNWNVRPKNITPFKKAKFLSGNYLRIIRDINLNVTPSRISVSTDYNRYYNEATLRNIYSVISNSDVEFRTPTFVDKEFYWNRDVKIKWDISRSLKFDFSTQLRSRLEDDLETQNNDFLSELSRDIYEQENFIRNNVTQTFYTHNFNLAYNVPINKIPFFNWTTLSTRYTGQYYWDYGPPINDIDFGNVIRNTNSWQLNGQLNMVNLYNKVEILKKINQEFGRGKTKKKKKEFKEVKYEKEDVYFKAGLNKSIIHKLKTEDVKVKVYDETGKEVKGEMEIVSDIKIRYKAPVDVPGAKIVITGKVEKKENPLIFAAKFTTRTLMMVRNISLTYKQTNGSTLPGYRNDRYNYFGELAPGLPFMAGIQDEQYPEYAIEQNWLVRNPMMLNPYIMTKKEDFSGRATIEPITGFKVDVNMSRSYTESTSEYYIAKEDGSFPVKDERTQVMTGSFNMSFLSIATSKPFAKFDPEHSEPFEDLKDYRDDIAYRQAKNRLIEAEILEPGRYSLDLNTPIYDFENARYLLDSTENLYMITDHTTQGYDGYNLSSQESLIPAFIAAYGGYNPKKVPLDLFPWTMMPNWRIRYNGLSKIEFVKKYLRSVNLTHSYKSTYQVSSFVLNSDWGTYTDNGISYVRDLQNNFVSQYDVTQVSIREQFSPLFGIDMNWKNSLTTKFEIKNSRDILLSMSNNQVIETSSRGYVLGLGYRFNEVPLRIKNMQGEAREFESDVNVRADFSIRNDVSVIRKLEEDNEQIQNGNKIYSIEISADYQLSERFTVQGYYKWNSDEPYISRNYPKSDTRIGISVRFELD